MDIGQRAIDSAVIHQSSMLAPPEEAIFTSKEDFIQSLRRHAMKEGYMINARDSTKRLHVLPVRERAQAPKIK